MINNRFKGLIQSEQQTVTIDLANGKSIVLRDAWFAGEGTGNTEEGNIAVRFEATSAEKLRNGSKGDIPKRI